MQAPGLPIQSWLIDTFPCVHKLLRVNVGYSRLNNVTIFCGSGGIEALDVGVDRQQRAVPSGWRPALVLLSTLVVGPEIAPLGTLLLVGWSSRRQAGGP